MSAPAAPPFSSSVSSRRRGPLVELWAFRQLVALLVVRELTVRYKRSFFGLLWTMLNPLLLMVVYTIVFTTIMPSASKNFAIFLLAGLLPWIFFSTAVMQGLGSILSSQDLIRKVRVPQAVFPLAVVGSNLVNLTLSVVPLLVVMLVVGQPITPAMYFLPVAVLILTIFTSGVTLLLASFTVFFRDVRHLTEVFLQILFYLSPIFYDVQQIGGAKDAWWVPLFRGELFFNPLTYLLPLMRDPVYLGSLPPLPTVTTAVGLAVGSLLLGFAVFLRLEPRHIHHF